MKETEMAYIYHFSKTTTFHKGIKLYICNSKLYSVAMEMN